MLPFDNLVSKSLLFLSSSSSLSLSLSLLPRKKRTKPNEARGRKRYDRYDGETGLGHPLSYFLALALCEDVGTFLTKRTAV